MNSTCFNRLASSNNLSVFIQKRHHVRVIPWRVNRLNRECYLDNTKTDYTDRNNPNEFLSYKRQKKPWQKVTYKNKEDRFNAFRWNENYQSDPKEARDVAQAKLNALKSSLLARGSAREAESYQPPAGVQDLVIKIAKSIDNSLDATINHEEILDMELDKSKNFKLGLITKCIEEFSHHMPSPYLNDMCRVRDVVDYFSTPVRGLNPYAAMLRKDTELPPNLSLIAEPIRFDKETDTFFDQISAYPGLISRVPGLRAAKKYPVLNQDEFQWPDI